ncbi:MAG: hypothetical protein ACM32E_33140, partial [Gemmatimonadota bacterium]
MSAVVAVVVYCSLLVLALIAGAALAWLIAGRALRQPRHLSAQGLDAQAALRRHPAGRARWGDPGSPAEDEAETVVRPLGPDDDQDFIDHRERQIRGTD